MILYTVTGKTGQAGYLNLADSGDLTDKSVYVNITNRCPCNCVFCLRQTKKMMEGNSLWLKGGEPSVETVMEEFLTNGLANLIHGKDITPELKGRFDTVSISLNAPDAEEYLALTRSKFGIQSYDALKEFAVKAKQYVPNVVLTVVEKVMSEEKIEICRKTCEELGVTLRVRPFED